MSFLLSYKQISNKLNSIARAMDEKVDTFVDQAIAIVEDYDNNFFGNSEDSEKDRSDMKAAFKKLFSIFECEKKRSINGYILFSSETREDCSKRNPQKNSTEITAALGAEWRALDQSEKDEWNKRAKSVAPQTSEEKRAKRSSSKKPSKKSEPKVTCDYSGCDKVVKNPTQHSDGCTYCATHFKKVVVEEKKAENLKAMKSPSKKPERKEEAPKTPVVKASPAIVPSNQNFDFKREKPVSILENPDWWVCKALKFDGINKNRYHLKTGLVLDINSNTLIGTYINSNKKTLDDVPETVKEWCRKSKIDVPEEEPEIVMEDEELEDE